MIVFLSSRDNKKVVIEQVSTVGILILTGRDNPEQLPDKEQLQSSIREVVSGSFTAFDVEYFDGIYSAEELLNEGEYFEYEDYVFIRLPDVVLIEEAGLIQPEGKKVELSELVGRIGKASKKCVIEAYTGSVDLCSYLESLGIKRLDYGILKKVLLSVALIIIIITGLNVLKKGIITGLNNQISQLQMNIENTKRQVSQYPDRLYVYIDRKPLKMDWINKLEKLPVKETVRFSFKDGQLTYVGGGIQYYQIPQVFDICSQEKLNCEISLKEKDTYEVNVKVQ